MALQISGIGIASGVLRIHEHTKHGVALPRPSFSFTTRSISTHVVGFQSRMRVMSTPSNSNPNTTGTSGGEEKVKQQQLTSTTGVGGEGPPLATILAGFVVLFGFCWVLFTIGSWLFNLIVTPPPLK